MNYTIFFATLDNLLRASNGQNVCKEKTL